MSKAVREGEHTATWQYARSNTIDLSANLSMLGLFTSGWLYVPNSVRRSSMAKKSTFFCPVADCTPAEKETNETTKRKGNILGSFMGGAGLALQ